MKTNQLEIKSGVRAGAVITGIEWPELVVVVPKV